MIKKYNAVDGDNIYASQVRTNQNVCRNSAS